MELKSALNIRDAVNAGKASAAEMAQAALARIEEADRTLGAFITVDRERVLARAADVDRRARASGTLPLAGVPVAVKDNICTRHLRTTCCSKILDQFRPPYHATAIDGWNRRGRSSSARPTATSLPWAPPRRTPRTR